MHPSNDNQMNETNQGGFAYALKEAETDADNGADIKSIEAVARWRYKKQPGLYDHLARTAEKNSKAEDSPAALSAKAMVEAILDCDRCDTVGFVDITDEDGTDRRARCLHGSEVAA
jgi:hypothetical protein